MTKCWDLELEGKRAYGTCFCQSLDVAWLDLECPGAIEGKMSVEAILRSGDPGV